MRQPSTWLINVTVLISCHVNGNVAQQYFLKTFALLLRYKSNEINGLVLKTGPILV